MSFKEREESSSLLVGLKSSCVSGSLGTVVEYCIPWWLKDPVAYQQERQNIGKHHSNDQEKKHFPKLRSNICWLKFQEAFFGQFFVNVS